MRIPGHGGRWLKALPGLLVLFCLATVSGCWLPQFRWGVPVEDIPKSADLLEKASDITVEDFFARRMLNRPRKAAVGNWMILHEDETYVYLGIPRFAGVLDNRREVSELFRTRRTELDARFPGWRKLDGDEMRTVLRNHLGKVPQTWEAVLEDAFIRVTGNLAEDVPVNVNPPPSKAFELHIDKASFAKMP